MNRVDALVIGFGKGGKTLAGALAKAGLTVAVVERSKMMYGGTCINVACIPTKSLVKSAALSAAIGGTFDERSKRYREAISEKARLTEMLRGKNYHKIADLPSVEVVDGVATFKDGHHVVVETDEGSVEYEAERIFINTGARPHIPTIEGLKLGGHVYVSETLLDLDRLPQHLVIIGGGYIGMEFASMYANFGSKVTVIQDGAVFLPREDAEIAQTVLESLEARGVRVLRSTETLSVHDTPEKVTVTVRDADGQKDLEADAVLVAAGRRPELTDLHPEAAGVELTKRGAVLTDEHLRTTAPGIWAMGDVVGGLQFTYISLDDYRIVRSDVLGDGERTTANRGAVPYSVFLDPPFSRVGLTEKEAVEKGIEVEVFKLPAAAIPKAQVLGKPTGLLKAVVEAGTGRILGVHLFCEESYETINIVKRAMDDGQPYTVLRDAIYTHPTMSEGLNDLFA